MSFKLGCNSLVRNGLLIAVGAMAVVACATNRPSTSALAAPERGENRAASQPTRTTTKATEVEQAPAEKNAFVLGKSDTAKAAQGDKPSKIKGTATDAAMKFVVVDKDKGPVEGIVVSLTAPNGTKYYTQETDSTGYAEVLVPVGQKYQLVYLSLGREDIAANVTVTDEPNQNIKLTLRYKGAPASKGESGRLILSGVTFDTGKATIRPESFSRLDSVLEYMTHKRKSRIEISGHTDNVGNAKANKSLSEKRARACRDYLVAKGIDASRIEAVGYGDERPLASNETEEGRQTNRRIEAQEL